LSKNLLRTVWIRRSLIWLFTVTDLKLRYKNSVLGFFWSFLEPLLMLGVFYVVFTSIFKNQVENYPLYLLSGLVIWYMFSRGTSMGMNSMIGRGGMLQKIYFRREILVISSVLTSFLMMLFELGVFFIFMIIFGVIPNASIIVFPLVLINLFFLTLGISFILGPLNVYLKDIQYIWNIVLTAGFFVVPLFYKMDVLPENVIEILKINPLVGIFDLSRAMLINTEMPNSGEILSMVGITLIVLVAGYLVFKKLDYRLVENL